MIGGYLEGRLSRKTISVLSIILVISFVLLFYWFVATDKETGVVDHKSIGGIKDETSCTLVDFTPHGVFVNPIVSDYFGELNINATITPEQISQLSGLGYNVFFIGNIELISTDSINNVQSGETVGYLVDSLTDFNNLVLRKTVDFEVLHNERIVIKNVH